MANFNLNKVILAGRLTADPELKATSTGAAFTDFNVAVNRPKSKEGEQETDFIHVITWRQRAEFVSKYFRKGSSICVVGSIQMRSWTDDKGNKRYATDVVADEINFVDSKSESYQVGDSSYTSSDSSTTQSAPVFEDLTDDEELPF